MPLGGKGQDTRIARAGGIKFVQQQFPRRGDCRGFPTGPRSLSQSKVISSSHLARQRKARSSFNSSAFSAPGASGQGPLVFGVALRVRGPSFFRADSPVKASHEVVAGALVIDGRIFMWHLRRQTRSANPAARPWYAARRRASTPSSRLDSLKFPRQVPCVISCVKFEK